MERMKTDGDKQEVCHQDKRAILETEAKNPYSSGLSAKETVNTQWDGKAENQKPISL